MGKLAAVFLLLYSLTFAQGDCSEYNKQAKNIRGKSPGLNMMIQTLKGYEFPQKISNKDEIFKKLSSVESLVDKNIDLVILWSAGGEYLNLLEKLKKVDIDLCVVNLDSIYNYEKAYTSLGKILGKEERANELSLYIKEKLHMLESIEKKIPQSEKLSVYYARSYDGLESECEGSVHSEVIELSAGINPVKCPSYKKERVHINYEKLLMMNPDVILVKSKNFYEALFEESKYAHLKAVKNKRVYLVPKKPINWIDNPPSFFKILGALWFANKLYPQYYDYDFKQEKLEFDRLFLSRKTDGKI